MSLDNNDGNKIRNPNHIPEDEERFCEKTHTSRNMNLNGPIFNENALSEEITRTCKGVMSIDELSVSVRYRLWKQFP